MLDDTDRREHTQVWQHIALSWSKLGRNRNAKSGPHLVQLRPISAAIDQHWPTIWHDFVQVGPTSPDVGQIRRKLGRNRTCSVRTGQTIMAEHRTKFCPFAPKLAAEFMTMPPKTSPQKMFFSDVNEGIHRRILQHVGPVGTPPPPAGPARVAGARLRGGGASLSTTSSATSSYALTTSRRPRARSGAAPAERALGGLRWPYNGYG